jgi:hypothetical protein
MTVVVAVVIAVAVIGVIVALLRLVPGRTETVRREADREVDGQGEQLSPVDRAR